MSQIDDQLRAEVERLREALSKLAAAHHSMHEECQRLRVGELEAQARAIAADQNIQRIKQLENKSRHRGNMSDNDEQLKRLGLCAAQLHAMQPGGENCGALWQMHIASVVEEMAELVGCKAPAPLLNTLAGYREACTKGDIRERMRLVEQAHECLEGWLAKIAVEARDAKTAKS